MTQLDKLATQLANERAESDLGDVERLLAGHGWERRPGKGSHLVFMKRGSGRISIPTLHGRRVKRVYVVDILRRLGYQE